LTIAAELHTLLQRANIPEPYVLAGHSFGGLYVRVFAAQYPTEVAGLVLVDASHPDQFTRTPEGRAAYSSMARMFRLYPMLARLGILRVIGFPAVDPALPKPQQDELDALMRPTQFAVTAVDEFFSSSATDAQVRASGTLGSHPLVVLTAPDQGDPSETVRWHSLQDELAELSSNSLHRDVEGANHTSIVRDRIHARQRVMPFARWSRLRALGSPWSSRPL
jgi:pimeloyl-ACP methyl ester carboxylesterase